MAGRLFELKGVGTAIARNAMTDDKPKRPRGRPVTHDMPDRIPDHGANILKAVLRQPPRDEDDWDYLKKQKTAENRGS